MRIELVTPSPPDLFDGNRVTALRWERILTGLGHEVEVRNEYSGKRCELFIALHARKSLASITAFRDRWPEAPLLVALTGSDLYRDLPKNAEVLKVLELATRLIVLHRRAVLELPESARSKTWVIYQSADQPDLKLDPPEATFQVAVVAHLLPQKDPFRAALAARKLPLASRVEVHHAGRAFDQAMELKAKDEEKKNRRYKWLGELTHPKALRLIASSHLVVIASEYEGGSNVLSEALVSSVPVLVSRTSGLVGTMGDDYPGYFPVGDTTELARLLRRVETEESLYTLLKDRALRSAWLVRPEQERASWQELLHEVSFRAVAQRSFF
ncbi:MAG: TIGR04348 family glycosyltransferase [Acidobacteria bacterium]|nr:MAG: TIGR04348 family glycosyltransferase [Acidobacteriota bacterium]